MHSQNTSLLKLLFATFPPQTGDLVAMMEAYELALAGHDKRDVEAAVHRFVRGEVVGHNPSFAPSASLLGSAVRQAMNDRLDSERRERKVALPPPDIEKTPESRARVGRMVAGLVAQIASQARTEDAARLAERKRWQDRMDARFMPDQSDEAMKSRLGIGDPEGDREVA